MTIALGKNGEGHMDARSYTERSAMGRENAWVDKLLSHTIPDWSWLRLVVSAQIRT